MTNVHVICRDRANLCRIGPSLWDSGDWDFPEEDAARLTGGMIYLHQTKVDPSYFGGKIESYRLTETENPHGRRIIFTFTFSAQAKGVRWRGIDHARAWTGGIVAD